MGVSAEQYSWPEAQLLVWTGSASPTTAVLVLNVRASFMRGWANVGPSLSGVYTNHLTGQRADVNISRAYTFDTELIKIEASGTAAHMELRFSGVNGSAGYKLFSGQFGSFALDGQEGALISQSLSFFCNSWSAY